VKTVDSAICAKCRGRKMLCGLSRCPIIERVRTYRAAIRAVPDTLSVNGASPPSAVVGEEGYPTVRVYIGVPPGTHGDEAKQFDDPPNWWGRLSLEDVIRLRLSMIWPYTEARATNPWTLYDREIPHLATSLKPTDAEAKLARRPSGAPRFSLREKPLGPRAPGEIRVTGNAKLPKQLERLIFDDAPATTAIIELYRAGVDIYTIQRALSLGLIGAKHRRRLVPSRWAITAVDTAIGDHLAEKVRDLPQLGEPMTGEITYMGNRYFVALIPGPLRFHYVERWVGRGGNIEVVVRESPSGKRSTLDGGFEAARLAILEKLLSMGRQASVYILRVIEPTYYVSVGNWQIRESIRRIQLKPAEPDQTPNPFKSKTLDNYTKP